MTITRKVALALAGAMAAGLAFLTWNAAAASPNSIGSAAAPTLSSSEKAGLTFTREEERMAHDLYTLFANKYQATVFSRIATSEQRHFEAVGVVLTKYGVSDPSSGAKAGVYSDATLQKLYDTWKAQGEKSATEAYQAAVALEKRDVADLKRLQTETSNTDLDRLYANLQWGSEHHLAAFTAAASGKTLPMGSGPGGRGNGPGNGPRNGTGMQYGPRHGQGQGGPSGTAPRNPAGCMR